MINSPVSVIGASFQTAWLDVTRRLVAERWALRNLVVHIESPTIFRHDFHQKVCQFAKHVGLLGPKHVAYTIFPYKLYERKGDCDGLFAGYNRENGLYARVQKRKPSWGTYFRRMTNYETGSGQVQNQLKNIISAIRTRDKISTAAYTIVIQKPGGETTRPMGGPCLNYIAVQLEPSRPAQLGLLAVYRNHDFLKRAYGNYWGLCRLISFLATETGTTAGPLTCVSSRAYVDDKKTPLRSLVASFE
jgi:hypothetical protein